MKPIQFCDKDGYKFRAYRLEGKAIGCPIMQEMVGGKAFEFVIFEYDHPNYGYFADAMFWWRSMHTSEWQPVPVASWTSKYTALGRFIRDYPMFKPLFRDVTQEPSPIKRSMKKIMEVDKE